MLRVGVNSESCLLRNDVIMYTVLVHHKGTFEFLHEGMFDVQRSMHREGMFDAS